jgi:hypothetical protein
MLRVAAGLEAGEMVQIAGESRMRCGWSAVAALADPAAGMTSPLPGRIFGCAVPLGAPAGDA